MALLLCIDSSTTHASVAVAKEGMLLGIKINTTQKEHASFLQPAIYALLKELNVAVTQLEAIAVTTGPGSYTGLRVGMASAKGLCFALQIPLIGLPTTLVMSAAARKQIPKEKSGLLCPMIDARRMEVFTALYSLSLEEISPISPKVLDSQSFTSELLNNEIYFFGDGSPKWQQICQNSHALFLVTNWNSANMISLAEQAFKNSHFLSLAYSAPEYCKSFHFAKS